MKWIAIFVVAASLAACSSSPAPSPTPAPVSASHVNIIADTNQVAAAAKLKECSPDLTVVGSTIVNLFGNPPPSPLSVAQVNEVLAKVCPR